MREQTGGGSAPVADAVAGVALHPVLQQEVEDGGAEGRVGRQLQPLRVGVLCPAHEVQQVREVLHGVLRHEAQGRHTHTQDERNAAIIEETPETSRFFINCRQSMS